MTEKEFLSNFNGSPIDEVELAESACSDNWGITEDASELRRLASDFLEAYREYMDYLEDATDSSGEWFEFG